MVLHTGLFVAVVVVTTKPNANEFSHFLFYIYFLYIFSSIQRAISQTTIDDLRAVDGGLSLQNRAV